jgi:hypothetical protein
MKPTADLLYILSQKGHCSYNRVKCERVMRKLHDRLEKHEMHDLEVAFSHMYDCNEGPGELIDACKKLMEKYTT